MIAQFQVPSAAMFTGVVAVLVMILFIAVAISTLLRNRKELLERPGVQVKDNNGKKIDMAKLSDVGSLRSYVDEKIELLRSWMENEFEECSRSIEGRRLEVNQRLDKQEAR